MYKQVAHWASRTNNRRKFQAAPPFIRRFTRDSIAFSRAVFAPNSLNSPFIPSVFAPIA
jgi:hypothetical protein